MNAIITNVVNTFNAEIVNFINSETTMAWLTIIGYLFVSASLFGVYIGTCLYFIERKYSNIASHNLRAMKRDMYLCICKMHNNLNLENILEDNELIINSTILNSMSELPLDVAIHLNNKYKLQPCFSLYVYKAFCVVRVVRPSAKCCLTRKVLDGDMLGQVRDEVIRRNVNNMVFAI